MNDKDNTFQKQIIIIDDEPIVIPGQDEGETPIIIIEEDTPSTDAPAQSEVKAKPAKRWIWFVLGLLLSALLCSAAVMGWRYYRKYVNIGIPVSVKSEQNIAKLSSPTKKEAAEVVMTTDSILGVALNFYELRGLKAEVTLEEPDSTDMNVYLYSRCADYGKNGEYLGSMVMSGKVMQSSTARLGYCAMANDNVVIGVARDEKVKDYVTTQGGSFFRQFILVSNGVLPGMFHLHGKVERRGLGRMGDTLYYIESKHAETMWDFADALREYGFVDAIYITGGDDCTYYRTSNGEHHYIGNKKKYPHDKFKGVVPWLVFKNI